MKLEEEAEIYVVVVVVVVVVVLMNYELTTLPLPHLPPAEGMCLR